MRRKGMCCSMCGPTPDYGKLSGRTVDDMIAGARVEVAPYKRDPMDFVLWKPSAADEPGWDSPWGRGRPGWHIECSAMAQDLLGPAFDIHGGGIDLQFPHHENEIAQSCCAHPEAGFANVWMHNEMVQVEGKKMSKSLGNFFTVRDLLDQGWPGEVIRFVMLSTHYRKPMDWTENRARDAHRFLSNLYSDYEPALKNLYSTTIAASIPEWHKESLPNPVSEIVDAVTEDLNTSEAVRIFREHARAKRSENNAHARQVIANGLFLGFFNGSELSPVTVTTRDALAPYRRELESMRVKAMQTKDFTELDYLKSALTGVGVECA